jgi:hypothetical protein
MEPISLGTPPPDQLENARLNAHWAAQVIAGVGETHLAARADTSQTAMQWLPGQQLLAGEVLPGPRPVRVALRLPDLTLLLLDEQAGIHDQLPLAGCSLTEAKEWAARALASFGDAPLKALVPPDYALPDHPLGSGARFAAPAAELEELARWFELGARGLAQVCAREPGATPVLCWPHHFDLGTLLIEATDPAGEATCTVGIGLSPGDEGVPLPYWYVNHWPGRPEAPLPSLALGRWHSEGWVGPLLDAAEIVKAGDPEPRVHRFLEMAVEASREILR